MKFVLNNEIRWIERPVVVERPAFAGFGRAVKANIFLEPIDVTEERAGFAHPRQRRELVDGGNQERRQPPVDRLVDRKHWERAVATEVAGGVDATDLQIGRRHDIWNARERLRREFRSAPRTIPWSYRPAAVGSAR